MTLDEELASVEARFAALGRATEFIDAHVPDVYINPRGYIDSGPKPDPDARLARILKLAEWLLQQNVRS